MKNIYFIHLNKKTFHLMNEFIKHHFSIQLDLIEQKSEGREISADVVDV